MMENLQKIANRIATGVIIAALLIGAALMARVTEGPKLFGYPWLATVFLIVAARLGLVMIINSLRRDGMVSKAAERRPR